MEIMIKATISIIVILGLLMVCFTYAQLAYTLNVIADTAQEAVLSQVTTNAPACFFGYRESSGTARYFDEASWQYMVDDTEVMRFIYDEFSLSSSGVRKSAGIQSFTINNLKTRYVNAEGSKVKFSTTLTVELPMVIMGIDLGNIKKEMRVIALYDARY